MGSAVKLDGAADYLVLRDRRVQRPSEDDGRVS